MVRLELPHAGSGWERSTAGPPATSALRLSQFVWPSGPGDPAFSTHPRICAIEIHPGYEHWDIWATWDTSVCCFPPTFSPGVAALENREAPVVKRRTGVSCR